MSEQATLLQEFYWDLILWDGEIIKIQPDNVANVQHKIDNKLDVKMLSRTVIYKNIKDFVQSGEVYVDRKLLASSDQLQDEAARAFGEPIITESGGVKAKWVKRTIPRREWTKYYSGIPSYKLLNDNDNYVDIAFVLPVHQIDQSRVQVVTGMELALLEKQNSSQY
jgi:hypothetical protein